MAALFGVRFDDAPPAGAGDGGRVVWVPALVRRKRELLAIFRRELSLPGHFGWNWDALEECLRDLSWLESPIRVTVRHQDVPFPRGLDQRRTYLGVLQTVAEFWRDAAAREHVPHEFQAVFPTAAEPIVRKLLSES